MKRFIGQAVSFQAISREKDWRETFEGVIFLFFAELTKSNLTFMVNDTHLSYMYNYTHINYVYQRSWALNPSFVMGCVSLTHYYVT